VIVSAPAKDEVDATVVLGVNFGRLPVTTALLGSVSLGVLRRSARPVLIVRDHTAKPHESSRAPALA
jgi:nucleotide-binding universal stress UspA family protein